MVESPEYGVMGQYLILKETFFNACTINCVGVHLLFLWTVENGFWNAFKFTVISNSKYYLHRGHILLTKWKHFFPTYKNTLVASFSLFLSVGCKIFLIFKCYMKKLALCLYSNLWEARNCRYLYDVFQDTIATEVKKLLALKVDFKSATGIDWKPETYVPSATGSAPNAEILSAGIAQQGDKVWKLNTQTASEVPSRTNSEHHFPAC